MSRAARAINARPPRLGDDGGRGMPCAWIQAGRAARAWLAARDPRTARCTRAIGFTSWRRRLTLTAKRRLLRTSRILHTLGHLLVARRRRACSHLLVTTSAK